MDKNAALDQFIQRINYLPDTDTGDFKRKLDLATMRLWQVLGHNSKEIDLLLWKLKDRSIYKDRLPVESARHLALDTAEKIRALI